MLDNLPSGHEAEARDGSPARTSLAVLIVGMHRSGTSALGGLLNLLGVATPKDLIAADQHNAKGYFEPQRIIDFHEELLAELGSPSNDPLPLTYGWVDSPVGRAAAETLADLIDEEFGDNAMCLFKDPRMCRLMPVWSAALALDRRPAVAILPCRHPLEVAGSLMVKGGLPRTYSLHMWLQHVVLGERFTRRLPRSFTDYDVLMDDWRTVSEKLQRDLGVGWPRDLLRAAPDIDAFLSGELRHHKARAEGLEPHDPLDALCARAWTALGRLQGAAYDAEAMAEMDAVWAELEAGLGVFGPLVIHYQRSEQTLANDFHARSLAFIDEVGTHNGRIEALNAQIADRDRHLRELDSRLADRDRQITERDRQIEARDELLTAHTRSIEHLQREVDQRNLQIAATVAALEAERGAHEEALQRLDAIERSTFWAISHPLRKTMARHPGLRLFGRRLLKVLWWTLTLRLGSKLRDRNALLRAGAAPVIGTAPQPGPAAASATAPPLSLDAGPSPLRPSRPSVGGKVLRLMFASGEADTPGHLYRVERWAAAARQLGAVVTVYPIDEACLHLDEAARADLLFIWRAQWNVQVGALMSRARDAGTPILFDVDDLMFEPDLAKVEMIDGIRSQGLQESEVQAFYTTIQHTLGAADYCSAPTPLLAERMRRFWKPTFVLPNGFDEETLARSRLAARRKRAQSDGLVRIGYATGSRTHQKDFAQCAEAVARVLREHPNCRLVLFKSGDDPVLDIGEFSMFDDLADQIEWRRLVPIAELPDELARFDISIAPLEVGNPFCEAKSELKFFEAALAGAVTVASPTEPFRQAIRHGKTGLLATALDDWYAALASLVSDAGLRESLAREALYDSLADYGPERRAELMLSVLEQVTAGGRRGARAFELDQKRAAVPARPRPFVPAHEVVFEHDRLGSAAVTVIIPLYNYAHFVEEALESIRAQTIAELDLIVIDDASTDNSLDVVHDWLKRNTDRFNRALLIRNTPNAGLGFTRNVGFANAETAFVLPLDADNKLLPAMCEKALQSARESGAAYVFPRIRQFGDRIEVMGEWRYDPARLIGGNFIDAMALVRKAAWADVGGYDHVRHGWEDYDFWCRLAERGYFGERLLDVLAEYRVHEQSMLHSETEVVRNKERLLQDIEQRHPWLRVDRPEDWAERVAALDAEPAAARVPPSEPASVTPEARLAEILPLLRCPITGAPLERHGQGLRAAGSDRVWPMALGRPVLFDGLGEPKVFSDDHVSNPLPERAIELIEQTEGWVLNLSAGGTARRFDHVIEAEFAVFRHTDVLADAHALPFADASFDLVVSMNAFEHYHTPSQAAGEILRVLKPGGRVLIRTAFLQPLHEAPWHFYNCTRYGLERWFEAFNTVDLQVSDNFNPIYALTWQMSEAEATLRREFGSGDAERLLETKGRDLVRLWRDPAARDSALWRSFQDLPQTAQEPLAAGFEYLGRKPE